MSKRALPYVLIALGSGAGGFIGGRLSGAGSAKSHDDTAPHAARTQASAPPRSSPSTPTKKAFPKPKEPERIAYTQALTDLKTFCWGDAKKRSVVYAGEAIAKFSVYVTVKEDRPTPFDFCVDELVFDDSSVVWGKDGVSLANDNTQGVAGYWFVFSDNETHWLKPPGGHSFRGQVAQNAPVCIEGTAPAVRDGDWGRYWGAAVSFAFGSPNQPPPERALFTPRFRSVTVVLSGAVIPPGLRFTLDNDHGHGGPTTSWCMALE